MIGDPATLPEREEAMRNDEQDRLRGVQRERRRASVLLCTGEGRHA